MLRRSLGPASVWCTDRKGGVSRPPFASCNVADHVGDDPLAVAENRRRVAATAGLPPPDQWVWLDQVHGADVHFATGPTSEPVTADASVTAVRGLPLAVLSADCAPVVLVSDDAVGAAHAGHRGLVGGVLERAVDAVRAVGRGSVRAFLGPCIRPARYEFGERDLQRVVAVLGPHVAAHTVDGAPALDIPAAVASALARAGVDELDDSGVCTAASPDHFSFRRDGTTGRQLTVVVMP